MKAMVTVLVVALVVLGLELVVSPPFCSAGAKSFSIADTIKLAGC